MPYCIVDFTYTAKYSPSFAPLAAEWQVYRANMGRGRLSGLDGGYRLDCTTKPPIDSVYREAKLRTSHKALPDIFQLAGDICISERIKDIIESAEPQIHQFFELSLLQRDDVPFEGRYFLLNICQVLDSIVIEKSSFNFIAGEYSNIFVTKDKSSQVRRTVKGDKIFNKQVWREAVYMKEFYISDHIFSEFQKFNAKGIDKRFYVKLELE